MKPTTNIFSAQVQSHLRVFRGQPVILDSDLAWFLGIDPLEIIEAVENNPASFPGDFVFRLTKKEIRQFKGGDLCLTDQSLSQHTSRFVFTTQGASILLSVFADDEFALAAIPVLRAFTDFWNKTDATQIQHPRKS